jgi:hypothetical protein
VNVLVACEFSGVVRRAFRRAGHSAVSCDFLPSDDSSPAHIQDDVRNVITGPGMFDLMIAHPPCQYLAGSGARWWKGREAEQDEAADFFMWLYNAPIPRVCVENPVGAMSKRFRPPDQYIQPWQFGHGETKKTGLWLKNLPLLNPTNVVDGREGKVWRMPPSPDRWKQRSITYQGIAEAMADQWGGLA